MKYLIDFKIGRVRIAMFPKRLPFQEWLTKRQPLPTFDEWCAFNGYVNDPKVKQVLVAYVKAGDKISYGFPAEEQRAKLLADMKNRLWIDGIIREDQ